jgi:serine O-acetyltransferase
MPSDTIFKIIEADMYRHDGLTGFRGFLIGWFKPGFRYFFIWRIISSMKKSSPFRFFMRLLLRRYRIKYGYEIDKEAQIGEGFYITNHVGTIVIGPVKIGNYCNVGHNVTIGRSYKNGVAGRPTLGNRVWIGTGAVLVGKISIGSNVLIAPNSYVNFDVPDHSLVIGNPGKIISKVNPTKEYINYVLHP